MADFRPLLKENGEIHDGSKWYSQNIFHIQGVISADTLQQFQAQANVGQSTGLIKVNANSVSAIPAPRA